MLRKSRSPGNALVDALNEANANANHRLEPMSEAVTGMASAVVEHIRSNNNMQSAQQDAFRGIADYTTSSARLAKAELLEKKLSALERINALLRQGAITEAEAEAMKAEANAL